MQIVKNLSEFGLSGLLGFTLILLGVIAVFCNTGGFEQIYVGLFLIILGRFMMPGYKLVT